MTSIALPRVTKSPLWGTGQLIGILLTVVLLVALVQWPTTTLHVLWDMVIPLLPAVFVVDPLLWRNVCPLATLNTAVGDRVGRRVHPLSTLRASWLIGIALLLLMVPARRFLFNTNGAVLAGTIVVVALLAIGLGAVYARRGGFCNALCPVLPVEKLYGQRPLLRVGSARCAECTLCTTSGCLDIAREKTVPQTLGLERHGTSWLRTGYGTFAAAFPGFIIGYFSTVDGELASWPSVYLTVAFWTAGSYLAVTAIVEVLRVRGSLMLPVLGAASIAIYYWFAAPRLAEAYRIGSAAGIAGQVLGLALAGWLFTGAVQSWKRRPGFRDQG